MKQTIIKHVQGNKLRLSCPLTLKIRNTVDGETQEREEDFYPSLQYPVTYKMGGSYMTYDFPAEVSGNIVTMQDMGSLRIGTYNVEILCCDDNGNPYRFAAPCVLHIVQFTSDADIEAGIEFNSETYTLEGAYFIQGEKGDKGDPFTWEDFTEEEILLLQKPAQDKANEVTELQEQWSEAETQRAQAETQRAAAEQTRQTAEGQRNTNEGQRQTNEQARSEAETLRQQAESQRQQAFQTAINNAEEATQEAENVNAQLSSDGGAVILTITNRQGNQTSKEVGFRIYKTYPSVAAMNADLANVEEGKFVMIAGSTEEVDTGKLYVRGASAFTFITDLSGAQGIKGDTGNGIASVTLNADYTLTIVFTDGTSTTTTSIRGEKGEQGIQGIQGERGLQGEKGEKGDKGDKGDAGTTDYNDLINKPTIPSKTSDLTNDSKFVSANSQTFTDAEKAQARQNIGAAGTGDVPTLPDNISYFSDDDGEGIIPMDGIRAVTVASAAAITVNPDVVTAINGAVGTAAITLQVPNDNLAHVWDILMTTDSSVAVTFAMSNGETILTPSGFSLSASKAVEVSVIGVGTKYYLRYGEFA